MAKFRNIVVHHYDKVDAEIVVGVMKKDLKDFIGYKQAIVDFLKSEAESEKENSLCVFCLPCCIRQTIQPG